MKGLELVGMIVAGLGIVACLVAGLARLAGMYHLGAVEAMTLFNVGMGLMLVSLVMKQYVLR